MSELDMDMKQLIEQKNMRTIDLSYKFDIAESTVRNWEKGRTIPKLRLDQLSKLLKLYGCSFEQLEKAMIFSLEKARTYDNQLAE